MITCVGLASGEGAGNSNCGEGPLFLSKNLKNERLQWHEMIVADPNADQKTENKYDLLADLNRRLYEESFEVSKKSNFFLSFGGDHSCAIGTWAGVAAANQGEDLGLIWIDAHMDAHTPETSESGNIHGMPLAVLLGHGDFRLTGIGSNFPKFKPENVVLIGVRSFEPPEVKLLDSMNVKIYYIDEVQKRGFKTVLEEVLKDLAKKVNNYCVSFDLDAVDPKIVKAVGTPVPNGIDAEEAIESMDLFANHPPLGFEVVEYNPTLDLDGKTFEFVQQLINRLIERRAS